MKYLKLFENFDINFLDVFGNSLIRGVKINKDEYIDDPKSRRVSTGVSTDEEYINFLKNYKNVGLQDPTQSVHFYLNPTKNQIDNLGWYGNSYRVIPEKGAKLNSMRSDFSYGTYCRLHDDHILVKADGWAYTDRKFNNLLNRSIEGSELSLSDFNIEKNQNKDTGDWFIKITTKE